MFHSALATAALIITITSTASTKPKLALRPKFYLEASKILGKDAIASELNAKKSTVNVLMLVFLVELTANAKTALTDLAKNIKTSHLMLAYQSNYPKNEKSMIELYKFIFP